MQLYQSRPLFLIQPILHRIYYKEFLEVYTINKNLTQEEKEIALWWSDDPKQSYGSSGHSYNIASISLRKTNSDFIYCGRGVCQNRAGWWQMLLSIAGGCKFIYQSQRPFPYIHTFIDTSLYSVLAGTAHSLHLPQDIPTQAAAMATVLTAIFGDNFQSDRQTQMHSGKKTLSA
jgi:hypothetical protein